MTSSKGQVEVSLKTSPKCQLLGHANETEIVIGEQVCAALIDTGSMVTSVSASFFEEYLSLQYPLQPLDSLMVECAGGQNLPYSGYIDATLKVPNCVMEEIDVPILVITDTSYNSRVPVTLGTNVIKVLKDNGVIPSDEAWSMAIESLCTSQAAISEMSVYSCRQIVIEPDSSIVVSARVGPSKEFTSGIVQAVQSLPGGLAIPLAAVKIDEKRRVFVQLVNQTTRTVTIPQRQKIAELHQASVVSDKFAAHKLHNSPIPETTKGIPVDLDESLLTLEQINRIQDMLCDWSDVFANTSTELGTAKGVKHQINLTDNKPFKDRARRILPAMYEEVKQHPQDMLAWEQFATRAVIGHPMLSW